MNVADVLELNRLVYRYAAAVDASDEAGFLDVFHPDARLRVYHPEAEEPFVDHAGHGMIGQVLPTMRTMYRRTAHLMTNHLVDVDGDQASGTLLCTARHLMKDPDDVNVLVVVIRYVDRYERRAGAWRIADRQIRFLWSERDLMVDSGM
jgi:3-phenylpropionate/cinnamic acid dioxygenase small subunit